MAMTYFSFIFLREKSFLNIGFSYAIYDLLGAYVQNFKVSGLDNFNAANDLCFSQEAVVLRLNRAINFDL